MEIRTYHILLVLVLSCTTGAALDIRDILGNAVLASDKAEFERIINTQDGETAKKLLDSVKGGETLFSLAIQMDNVSMVQLLVQLGANPQKKSYLRILGEGAKETPLKYAQRWKSLHLCNTSIDAIISYLAQETCIQPVDDRHVNEPDKDVCSLCIHDDECQLDEACENNQCENTCSSTCIEDSSCTMINHIATCKCSGDMVGNPYTCQVDSGCYECVGDDDCTNEMFCKENRCEDPCEDCTSTWGRCNVTNHKPLCACPKGYEPVEPIGCKYADNSMEFYISLTISTLLLLLFLAFCIMYFILRQRYLSLQNKLKSNNEASNGQVNNPPIYDEIYHQANNPSIYDEASHIDANSSQHINETMYLEPVGRPESSHIYEQSENVY